MKKRFLQLGSAIFIATLLIMTNACKKTVLEVLAGYTYSVDANDFRKVTFTNASQNATTYKWNFGDGQTSTEANPVHTFSAEGSYQVQLTATGSGGDDVSTQTLIIKDANKDLTALAGTDSKTWKLLRKVAPNRWPLEVGPYNAAEVGKIDKSTVWWAMGKDNDEIANRPCSMNDEFTFYRNGDYKFDDKGDFWVEGNVYAKPDNICAAATAANMKGVNGEDLTKWGSATNKFSISGTKLTVTGLGAWVGLSKVGTDVENKVPQASVTYNILKLTDGDVDTLMLEVHYKFAAADANPGGTWKMILVHYDDPTKEPAIPSAAPKGAYTYAVSGLTVAFTNTTTGATSYAWDYGDGKTSTVKEESHTYAAGGFYTVKMTAKNAGGESVVTKEIFITDQVVSDAVLQGASWKLRIDNNSVFVGPALGDGSWWSCPKANLDGTATGPDNWSCMANDEFIFKAGGVYEYKANGDVRNDGYMGTTNGCKNEADLTGNAAAFNSGVHAYAFTAPSGNNRATITLTNGAKGAAFIGFYKGYYGGENSDGTKAPNGGNATNKYEVIGYAKNGTKEYLVVSVDISAKHDGSAAWSAVLYR